MRRTNRHANFRNLALRDELHIPFGRRSARDLAEWTSASRGPLAEPWRLTSRARYDRYDQLDNLLEIPSLSSPFNGLVTKRPRRCNCLISEEKVRPLE